jgi:hypothetical protein
MAEVSACALSGAMVISDSRFPGFGGRTSVAGVTSWDVALVSYLAILLVSFTPVARALMRKVKLHPGGPSFADTSQFSADNVKRLEDHWDRLKGTLVFWKNHAAKHHRFYIYSLVWTIISSVAIPVIVQASRNTRDPSATWLVTLMSSATALLLGFTRGFKVEQNFRVYREGESAFYDTYRRLLDTPQEFGNTEEEQLHEYFTRTAIIREHVRKGEIDNLPSLDSIIDQRPGASG